jgi:hypothetical protein
MPTTKQAPDDEVTQLRARVDELEAELSRRQLRARVDELEAELSRSDSQLSPDWRARQQSRRGTSAGRISDSIASASNRATDESLQALYEIKRVGRGLVLASLDQVGLIADFFSTFVNEVLDRNQPEPDAQPREILTKLPGDVVDGFSTALNQSINGARNPINTFYEKYREVRPRRESGELRVTSTSPADNSSGPAPSTVTVTFSRNIQATDANFSSSLVVKKGDKTVPGTVTLFNQDTLLWTPSATLDAGTYVVRVSNIESYLGRNIVRMRDPFTFVFTVNTGSA